MVPGEEASSEDGEEEEDVSLLHDEVRQAMRARKAKLHRCESVPVHEACIG